MFKRIIPSVAVPIRFVDIFSSLWQSCSKKNKILANKFNAKITDIMGYRYVMTFQSGYYALYFLLINAKYKSNKNEIIIPAFTCPSVYYAVINAGLKPIFADSDESTFNISLKKIEEKITDKTLAILTVNLFGSYTMYIQELRERLKQNNNYNVIIIEDLCQYLGDIKKIRNEMSEYADFAILSFGRAKMISTIQGGALLFNDEKFLITSNHSIKNNSIVLNLFFFLKSIIYALIVRPIFYPVADYILDRQRKIDPFNLKNYKNLNHNHLLELTSYQYSLGINMIGRLNEFNEIRRRNSLFYLKYFTNNKYFIVQKETNNLYLKFAVVFKTEQMKKFAIDFFKKKGIKVTTPGYPVLPTLETKNISTSLSDFPGASFIASKILVFPTHPSVQINKYSKIFDEFFKVLDFDMK